MKSHYPLLFLVGLGLLQTGGVAQTPARSSTHSVSLKGETLASIAKSYGVSLKELKAANSHISINGKKVSDYDVNQPLPVSQLITIPSNNNIANTNGTLKTEKFIEARRSLIAKIATTTRATNARVFPYIESSSPDTLPANSVVYVMAESKPFCNVLYSVGSQYSHGWVVSDALRFTGRSADVTKTLAAMSKRQSEPTIDSLPLSNSSSVGGNSEVVKQARRFLGVPYVWGGASPRGTDASGLVLQAFRLAGKRKLPRVSRDQYRVGTPVSVKDLKPGDRLYFSVSGRSVDHTGLYAGNGRIIEAHSAFHKVIERDLFKSAMYERMYIGARRGGEG